PRVASEAGVEGVDARQRAVLEAEVAVRRAVALDGRDRPHAVLIEHLIDDEMVLERLADEADVAGAHRRRRDLLDAGDVGYPAALDPRADRHARRPDRPEREDAAPVRHRRELSRRGQVADGVLVEQGLVGSARLGGGYAEVLQQTQVTLPELPLRTLRVGAAGLLGEHAAQPGLRLRNTDDRHAAQVVLEVAADLRHELDQLLPGERADDAVGRQVVLTREL